MLEIRVPSPIKPFFSTRVTLDGADFILRFEWNSRSGWFLGIADQDNVAISSPTKISPDWDLLGHETDDRRPPGALVAFDTQGEGAKVGYEDLGVRHRLIYLTEAEL